MSISFFSPIHADSVPNPRERWSFLRGSIHLFDFGQKAYAIKHFDNTQIKAIEIAGSKRTWIGVTLRVIAIANLIIPFILLLGAFIYRLRNNFQVVFAPNRLNQIPDEVLSLIAKRCGHSCLQLEATSQRAKRVLENDPVIKENRIILHALEKSYHQTRFLSVINKSEALNAIALALTSIDRKKALEIAKEAIDEANRVPDFPSRCCSMMRLITTLAALDKEKGIEFAGRVFNLAKTIDVGMYQVIIFANIAKSLAIIDQNLAVAAAFCAWEAAPGNILEGNDELNDIAKTIALLDALHARRVADKVLARIDEVQDGAFKVNTLTIIAEGLRLIDPQKACEIARQATREAGAEASPYLESKAYIAYTKILVTINPEKAIRMAERAFNAAVIIADNYMMAEMLAAIAEVVIAFDTSKAVALTKSVIEAADQEPIDSIKAQILDNIVPCLILLPPQNRVEMIDRAYNVASGMLGLEQKSQVLAALASACASSDPQKAVNFVKQAISGANTNYRNVAKTIALLDKESAKDVAHDAFVAANSAQALDQKYWALAAYAEALAAKNPELALTGANEIGDIGRKILTIAKVATCYSSGS